ncbi:ABC transporter permease [Crenobacter sp. SG2303]|uniref:Xylose transport system permease protein XylH n=1 Tax=Crenobacter oryzisoli TaxID=3056844 RepID=A0ABT7XRT0_9NEIS|nr:MULTISPECIES: ABC transporter permease [unclassified Crenobacter]MDN0076497.1 ABC transporter permease [Crenobacter sp. SG2303]MDN0083265.1 ABC transporter permease [Crenobacter sp. SG2305]
MSEASAESSKAIRIEKKGAGSDASRLAKQSWFSHVMHRPESGAVSGLVFVYVFFVLFANGSGMFSAEGLMNIFKVSAELGILAVSVSLLMIAGEFDLSIGSMVALAGLIIGVGVAKLGLSLPVAVMIAFVFSLLIGAFNGYLVVRTKLPSFIVSLATMFILRGVAVAATRMLTGKTQISYVVNELNQNSWVVSLFSGHLFTGLFQTLAEHGVIDMRPDGLPAVQGIPMSILWWLAISALATWMLLRTRLGNWIFATGGDLNAARNMGVPVDKVRILLFMFSAVSATLFATIQVLESGSADTLRGIQKEFEAIIAAVIGGSLLTGGYGSAIGSMFGALIFGTVQIGMFYTGIDTDWFKVFLGVMVLLAVLFNDYIRKMATSSR